MGRKTPNKQTNKQIKQKPHLSQSAAPMQAFLVYWYER